MLPLIIQGGMGVQVSSWALANAVSARGQLGVVSGTALDVVLLRSLVDGDPGGHYRRALAAFPVPQVAAEILEEYFRPGGRGRREPYPTLPMHKRVLGRWHEKLLAVATFAEVFLARQGHDGAVGINFLTKIQLPTLPSLYGAMLAGVEYVLMGAGIPREIPGVLDRLSRHETASVRLDVQGGTGEADEVLDFDPRSVSENPQGPLNRPGFLPIVASNSLATMLARKSTGSIEGFIVEGPTAGGHNAPPRGPKRLNERGEPVYGDRDVVDLGKLAGLGLPFWVAGGEGSPERLQAARAAGAVGIQVGTLFAYADESGLDEELKRRVIARSLEGEVSVRTDDRASPTGFPFKTVDLSGSLSSEDAYEARERVCDLGYLRTPYRRPDGRIGFRCASEPVETFVKKGGARDDTAGRRCLCNALMANIGKAQVREGGDAELPLLTSGDDLRMLGRFLAGRTHYTAGDVLDHLLGIGR